ncbi:hypothetical protein P23_0456 [Acinetobacter calcoaceticus]|nr:hypothetical protein P23_0456 [Acinetobacter calcoaceticus]
MDCSCGTFSRTLSNKLIEHKTYKDVAQNNNELVF